MCGSRLETELREKESQHYMLHLVRRHIFLRIMISVQVAAILMKKFKCSAINVQFENKCEASCFKKKNQVNGWLRNPFLYEIYKYNKHNQLK